MNVLIALLLVALAGAASLSPLLAIAAAWLALALLLLAGINVVRRRLERPPHRGSQVEEILGWLE